MITVMELADLIKKARKSGALNGSDTLYVAGNTGCLSVARKGQWVGIIDLVNGDVRIDGSKRVASIKGMNPRLIVVDEISAFLEGRPDVADTGHKRDEDVTGPPKPYIQRGEGI